MYESLAPHGLHWQSQTLGKGCRPCLHRGLPVDCPVRERQLPLAWSPNRAMIPHAKHLLHTDVLHEVMPRSYSEGGRNDCDAASRDLRASRYAMETIFISRVASANAHFKYNNAHLTIIMQPWILYLVCAPNVHQGNRGLEVVPSSKTLFPNFYPVNRMQVQLQRRA